jgi:tRNA nucleotidyltransferase (CCA-adding enzyme)
MQLYVVGGAVRDALLGLPASDRDWVAVGATPQALLDQGFKPVGKDFPVFLHPQTGEEVALARTERKTAPGYHGFVFHAAPGVTIEDDLRRRDLTINAIAQAEDGALIDPFGGQADLKARVLRHVSPAFVEDPVRLLRLARFAARFVDFSIAPETMALLRTMVDAGEIDALVPERAWQELSRGLLATQPSRMLEVLQTTGAWPRLLPPLKGRDIARAGRLLDTLAARPEPTGAAKTAAAWAVLLLASGAGAEDALAASQRLKVPSDCRDLALLLVREAPLLLRSPALAAREAVGLFQRCDAFRRPDRFVALLDAADIGLELDTAHLRRQFDAALAVDAGLVVAQAQRQGLAGQALANALLEARVLAVDAVGVR